MARVRQNRDTGLQVAPGWKYAAPAKATATSRRASACRSRKATRSLTLGALRRHPAHPPLFFEPLPVRFPGREIFRIRKLPERRLTDVVHEGVVGDGTPEPGPGERP